MVVFYRPIKKKKSSLRRQTAAKLTLAEKPALFNNVTTKRYYDCKQFIITIVANNPIICKHG